MSVTDLPTDKTPDVDDSQALPAEEAEHSETIIQLPFGYAKRHSALVSQQESGYVLHCLPDVSMDVLAEVRRLLKAPFSVDFQSADSFELMLTEAFQRDSSEAKQMMEDIGKEVDLYSLADEMVESEDLLENEDDAPIIKLINAMLSEAIKESASDIHIETFEHALQIRFRVDGVLREVLKPNRKLASLLVSRIKVMAKLDIAEKRIPQDGRISLRIGGRAVDVRVSTMPTGHGERVVLRLLDKNSARLDLEDLGMTDGNRIRFSQLIDKPHGIILVTGPTGSGKSTTLYAGLTQIDSKERNILTVEDPIEYAIEGIGQTQVNTKVDMTFARGLRAILRQDPDVILVGEIRDEDTAHMVFRAASMGLPVFSTMHTEDSLGAVLRLTEDFRVPLSLVGRYTNGIINQRLVRKLCFHCRSVGAANQDEASFIGAMPGTKIWRTQGCEHCQSTGFCGRTTVGEILQIPQHLDLDILSQNLPAHRLLQHARNNGFQSLHEDSVQSILAGVIDIHDAQLGVAA